MRSSLPSHCTSLSSRSRDRINDVVQAFPQPGSLRWAAQGRHAASDRPALTWRIKGFSPCAHRPRSVTQALSLMRSRLPLSSSRASRCGCIFHAAGRQIVDFHGSGALAPTPPSRPRGTGLRKFSGTSDVFLHGPVGGMWSRDGDYGVTVLFWCPGVFGRGAGDGLGLRLRQPSLRRQACLLHRQTAAPAGAAPWGTIIQKMG
jgi:hypothetical protein